MAGVVKEYRCMAHGVFESSAKKPLCPEGCDTVERVFITPPALRSARTGNIDSTLETLAASHGMTDISNAGGVAAKRMSGAKEAQYKAMQQFIRQRYGIEGPGWGGVPNGKTYNVDKKAAEDSHYRSDSTGPGAVGAYGTYGGAPDNPLAEVRDAGALKPKPVLVRKDHEKLSVSAARPPA